jgi:hypothetical protein
VLIDTTERKRRGRQKRKRDIQDLREIERALCRSCLFFCVSFVLRRDVLLFSLALMLFMRLNLPMILVCMAGYYMDLGLCESGSTLDMIPCQFSLVLAMMREFHVFCSHVDVNFLISPSMRFA